MTIIVNYILHECHTSCFKNYFLFSIVMLLDSGNHCIQLLLLFMQHSLKSPRLAPEKTEPKADSEVPWDLLSLLSPSLHSCLV